MNEIAVLIRTADQDDGNASLAAIRAFSDSDVTFPDALTEAVPEFAARVLVELGMHNWDVSIMLCDDEVIAGLNKEYRHKDGPTDVLSFEQGDTYLDEDGNERFLAGDIVISLPSVQQNAVDFAVDFLEELRRVIVHGLLHLAGHDHQSNDDSEPMLQLQEKIMQQLTNA